MPVYRNNSVHDSTGGHVTTVNVPVSPPTVSRKVPLSEALFTHSSPQAPLSHIVTLNDLNARFYSIRL